MVLLEFDLVTLFPQEQIIILEDLDKLFHSLNYTTRKIVVDGWRENLSQILTDSLKNMSVSESTVTKMLVDGLEGNPDVKGRAN